jgi:hypothetical protein
VTLKVKSKVVSLNEAKKLKYPSNEIIEASKKLRNTHIEKLKKNKPSAKLKNAAIALAHSDVFQAQFEIKFEQGEDETIKE